jgi:S1-C subfamily serine protease
VKKFLAILVTGLMLSVTPTPANTDHKPSPFVKIEIMSGKSMLGWGSATYIGNGYFVTANHIVDGKKNTYTITDDNGAVYPAAVVFRNATYDFAVVEVAAKQTLDQTFNSVSFNCNDMPMGTHIRLHGNPSSDNGNLDFIYTEGEIVGSQRTYAEWPVVYITDATVIWGMSGGAATDDNGNIIGITVGVDISQGSPFPISMVVPSPLICNTIEYYKLNLKL